MERKPVDAKQVRRVALDMRTRNKVKAFAVSGFASTVNPQHELQVKEILRRETGLPVSCGHELSDLLNFRTRALTAVANSRILPDPTRARVSSGQVVLAHLGCVGLDFLRGAVLAGLGLGLAGWTASSLQGLWPLSLPITLGLLILGTALPAGAFVRSVGGWRKRGVLFAAGAGGFLIGSILL